MDTVTIHKNKLMICGGVIVALLVGGVLGYAAGTHRSRIMRTGMMRQGGGAYMQGGRPQGGMMRTRDYQGNDNAGTEVNASGTAQVPNNK